MSEEYFRTRAADERKRSEEATHPRAIAVHLELAMRYDEMAKGLNYAAHTTMQPTLRQRVRVLLRLRTPSDSP